MKFLKRKSGFSAKFCALFVSLALLACSCAPIGVETKTPSPGTPPTQPSLPNKLPTSTQTSRSATPTTEASPTQSQPTQTDIPTLQPATKKPGAISSPTPHTTRTPTAPPAPGSGGSAVGFIYADWKDDWGYTQAAHAGSLQLAQEFSGRLNILENENIDPNGAAAAMEKMIRDGARIIFATDPGYEDAVLKLAERHPEVAFLQQGGTKVAANVGAPFGNAWEAVYLSGITAGKMTKNNRLGFVATFGQPRVLLEINAFALGARSVNPDAAVRVVFTQSECNSVKQQEAIFTLLDTGADVVAQHQNCTQTVIEISERNGVMSIGYNVDGSSFAPNHWLTGPVWNWGPHYVNIVTALQAGQWNTSPYHARYRAGLKDGLVDLAPFGASVPAEVKTLVLARKQAIINGTLYPFDGPVKDQAGQVRIPAGVRPSVEDLETMNYLVDGVIGDLP